MNCKACKADLNGKEVSKGISKKNNKPWQGIKCDCGDMNFIPFGQGKYPPVQNPTPAADKTSPNTKLELIINQLNSTIKKLDALDKRIAEIAVLVQAAKSASNAMSKEDENWATIEPETPAEIPWNE